MNPIGYKHDIPIFVPYGTNIGMRHSSSAGMTRDIGIRKIRMDDNFHKLQMAHIKIVPVTTGLTPTGVKYL
ncbi:hypothetical protein IIC38_09910 [candidate division KSB1 bacterium]|nr:hypothetical protein [candidate division KSB1 bacterium]